MVLGHIDGFLKFLKLINVNKLLTLRSCRCREIEHVRLLVSTMADEMKLQTKDMYMCGKEETNSELEIKSVHSLFSIIKKNDNLHVWKKNVNEHINRKITMNIYI